LVCLRENAARVVRLAEKNACSYLAIGL